jgi:hypothetical protein
MTIKASDVIKKFHETGVESSDNVGTNPLVGSKPAPSAKDVIKAFGEADASLIPVPSPADAVIVVASAREDADDGASDSVDNPIDGSNGAQVDTDPLAEDNQTPLDIAFGEDVDAYWGNKNFKANKSKSFNYKGYDVQVSSDQSGVSRVVAKRGDKEIKFYTDTGLDNSVAEVKKSIDDGSIESKKVNEGFHFNTKIKQLEAYEHPVKVRLGLKECRRMTENLLNPEHPSPCPADDQSRKILESASKRITKIMEDMKQVQVQRRRKL